MNWLKKKIKDWLGITKLQNEYDLLSKKHDKLQEEYFYLNKKYGRIVDDTQSIISINKGLRQRNEFILKNFQIAVDHNPYENQSWAVVCINGKPDYVNFMDLSHTQAREMMYYLKQFDQSGRIVDSPHRTMKLDIFKF